MKSCLKHHAKILKSLGLTVAMLMVTRCGLDEISYAGKACPCGTGWVCDTTQNVCIKEDSLYGMDATINMDAATNGGTDGTLGDADAMTDADSGDADAGWNCEEILSFSCDDSNECTDDSCEPTNSQHDADGCVHTAVTGSPICQGAEQGCEYSACDNGVCTLVPDECPPGQQCNVEADVCELITPD